ncbi:TetR/AcrR family transcriptional regulator [Amycolatopsis circi]|uniref:TetR/AcrR family transcriptional regulator n=1 Tax=Amycolatopsis circi TaxID=871959 RepID=UPI000E25584A|nr:TetR/AcrR family transcriptional regulator [Amycolatopsis circi]
MPRTSERGGPQTRARILEVANRLFLERGYEAVTVAEVAREAGVSSVTVFNHFARKEDLFLDRAADAADLLRAAVRDHAPGIDVLTSLQDMTFRLSDERAPLSGLSAHAIPFFRTVAGSPALIARARAIGSELQSALAEELTQDPAFDGDGGLLAAFFIAGYSAVLVETVSRRIDGEPDEAVAKDHRDRLGRLFTALRDGVVAR